MARQLSSHATFVLVSTLAVFAWREILPLMMVGELQADPSNPWNWSRIGLLFLAGVVLPVTAPREYTPVIPEVSRDDPVGTRVPAVLTGRFLAEVFHA